MQSGFLNARTSLEADGIIEASAIPAAIANSWHRCLGRGLDPRSTPVDAAVSHQELYEARQKHETLMAVVRPELELLSNQIAGTNYLMAFASNKGVVLDAFMDHEFRESSCSQSIRNGTIWSEELRGTNALGLAMHTGEISAVTGSEHFLAEHAGVSCVAAPIFDSRGRIAGLLDASSELTGRQHHTQALVALAATNIENRLFVDGHRDEYIIQFHPREEYLTTQSVGMISCNEDGQITGANRYAYNIFNGLDLSSIQTFSELFQDGFGSIISAMRTGKIVRLVDWLHSSYFARMRLTHPSSGRSSKQRTIPLFPKPVYASPKSQDDPVFYDEKARNSMKLALRAARSGLPVCVSGSAGTGRSTFAQAMHNSLFQECPLITIECKDLNYSDPTNALRANLTNTENASDIADSENGTLVIEDIGEVRGAAAEKLHRAIAGFRNTHPSWILVATQTPDFEPDSDWSDAFKITYDQFALMTVHLPDLKERSDFGLVASHILARISPSHQLSHSASSALQNLDNPQNFSDLANQLRLLAVHCPIGVLREEHVHRHLGLPQQDLYVCERCLGNSVREAKCREINRIFQQCNSNVALTARSLGVSRNTVYAHIPRLS